MIEQQVAQIERTALIVASRPLLTVRATPRRLAKHVKAICSVAVVLCAAEAIAQLPMPQPNQPASKLQIAPSALKPLKPDLKATITGVQFACPGSNNNPPLVKIYVTLKNNGAPFQLTPMDVEWFVDDVRGGSSWAFPEMHQAQMNSPSGKAITLDTPTHGNFVATGKAGITTLATPKSVNVKFTIDVKNLVNEVDEGNNTANFATTIPAKLCP